MKKLSASFVKLFFIFFASYSCFANAAPGSFVYEGVLLDASGVPITIAVSLSLNLYDPNQTCLLYQEQQSVTPNATGSFSVLVGAGSRTGNDPGLSFETIFTPTGSIRIAGANCTPGYIAATADTRKLVIMVNGVTLSPSIDISAAPFAIGAALAEKVGTYTPSKLLRSDGATAVPALDDTKVTLLMSLLTGTLGSTPSGAGEVVSKAYVDAQTALKLNSAATFGGDVSGVYSGLTVAKIQGRSVAATTPSNGQVLQWDGSAWSPATPATGGATGTASGDLTGTYPAPFLSTTGVTAGSYAKVTVDSKGRVTAGASLANSDIVTGLGFSPMSSTLSSGKFFVGNISNSAEAVFLSGDGTLSSSGALTVTKTTSGQSNKLLQLDGLGVATVAGLGLQSGTGSVTLASSTTTINHTLTFPASLPAVNGQILSVNTAGFMSWISPNAGNFATVTTAAMTIYVRSDGSDTACDGSANLSSSSAPSCAFQTLQGALDKTPDVIKHTVDIKISTPLSATIAGRPMAVVNKIIGAVDEILGPLLIIEGNGTPYTITNASAATSGLLVLNHSRGVYLKNLGFTGFDKGVEIDGGVVLLDGMLFNNNAQSVTVSRAGMAMFKNNLTTIYLPTSGSGKSVGIDISGGGSSEISTNLAINIGAVSNARGIGISDSGSFSLTATSTLTITENAASLYVAGVDVSGKGRFASEVGAMATFNMGSGNTASTAINVRGGSFLTYGSITLNSVAGNGLYCDMNATCSVSGAFNVNASFSSGHFVQVRNQSSLIAEGDFQISSQIGSSFAGVDVADNSSFVYRPNTSGKNLLFNSGAAGSTAIRLSNGSTFSAQPSASMNFTFSGVTNIFSASGGSTITNNTSYGSSIAGNVMVDKTSNYLNTNINFPKARRICDTGMIAYGMGPNAFCMDTTDSNGSYYTGIASCETSDKRLCSTVQYGVRCAYADYIGTALWTSDAQTMTCTGSTITKSSPTASATFNYRCCN